VVCLLTLKAETFAQDPHPQPPKCFLDAPTVDQLVRDMQAHPGRRQDNELPQLAELSLAKEAIQAAPAPSAQEETEAEKPAWPPKRTQATAAFMTDPPCPDRTGSDSPLPSLAWAAPHIPS
jgi:hypothetical protein